MLVGIPKEIKNHEYRVGLTPRGVRELISYGHQIIIQKDAGSAIGYFDKNYKDAGAKIVKSAKDIYSKADLVVKVKEFQPGECSLIKPNQILFCYLHLAAELKLTKNLMKTGGIYIAYETITDEKGNLPLLTPMSEIAGRVSVQVGAHCLEKSMGGKGVLLGGAPGVAPGKIVILGGGFVGLNAAIIATGFGAEVTIIESCIDRIRELELHLGGKANIIFSTKDTIEEAVKKADLLIGAVLIPGAAAPKLVDRKLVSKMKPGSVIVDVAVDQGGCIETIRPTTHEDPIYEIDGVIHYGVTNIPAAVAYTSTQALENSTLPYTILLANNKIEDLLAKNKHFRKGLNIYKGKLTNEEVANSLHLEHTPINSLIEIL